VLRTKLTKQDKPDKPDEQDRRAWEMTSGRGEVGIMPQAIVPSPYPQKICCENCRIGLASGNSLHTQSHLCLLCDCLFSRVPSKEPAMNGPSGFQEVRSSTSRSSPNRLLHEQQPQFGTGAWHLLRTHNLIALSTDISRKRSNVPKAVPCHTNCAIGS
jgi:hypothetical protein